MVLLGNVIANAKKQIGTADGCRGAEGQAVKIRSPIDDGRRVRRGIVGNDSEESLPETDVVTKPLRQAFVNLWAYRSFKCVHAQPGGPGFSGIFSATVRAIRQ